MTIKDETDLLETPPELFETPHVARDVTRRIIYKKTSTPPTLDSALRGSIPSAAQMTKWVATRNSGVATDSGDVARGNGVATLEPDGLKAEDKYNLFALRYPLAEKYSAS